MKQRLAAVLAVVAVVVILSLFVLFADWGAILAQLARANGPLLGLASAALVAGLALYARRWHNLLTTRPPASATFHAANIGHAANTLLPLRAGEPARIAVLGRSHSLPLAEVTSSVVVERLFEQIMRLTALVSAALAGAGLGASPSQLLGLIGGLALFFGGLLWLIRNRESILDRWPRTLARLPRVTEGGARTLLTGLLAGLAGVATPRRFVLGLAWSLGAWVCFALFHYLTLIALPLNLTSPQTLALALGALALAPPSAPTQPGLYHASLVVPLDLLGFEAAAVTAYAVILHALQMGWMIALGLWGLWASGASFRELVRPNDRT